MRRDLDALLDGDYLESFGLDRCCEELRAVVALASELRTPFALSASVAQAYTSALERYGPVDGELRAVALLEEQAGMNLRRSEGSLCDPPEPSRRTQKHDGEGWDP